MNKNQMNVCDRLIIISRHGIASLNVSVAASIILHRFYHWALSASSSANELLRASFVIIVSCAIVNVVFTTNVFHGYGIGSISRSLLDRFLGTNTGGLDPIRIVIS